MRVEVHPAVGTAHGLPPFPFSRFSDEMGIGQSQSLGGADDGEGVVDI